MIQSYINKLMENLPETITKREKPILIDLILGGGAFNGSYILGALYFLKELERKNYVIINRISTCSISSILALLYLTDNLDKANELYFDILQDFKSKGNLSKLFKLKDIFRSHITDEICSNMLSKKLYICYNNIKYCKKKVVNKYNNIDDLFETITMSCFIPFFIDFNPTYKNKYIDGIIPYFFHKSKKNVRRIYLDVYTLDKLIYTINVKNEKNNYHRLFEGLLDIHEFFIKDRNTTMCSDVDQWSIYHYKLYYIYAIIERCTIYFIGFISYLKSYLLIEHYDMIKPYIEKFMKIYFFKLCF